MKLLYVFFMIGIIEPLSPHYKTYLETHEGSPIFAGVEFDLTDEDCMRRLNEVEKYHIPGQQRIVFSKCIEVAVPDDERKGS